MEIQVSVHDWLALPMATRVKLREIFKIPRSSHTLVEGNVVKSDGTTYEDLKQLTVPKMQAYLEVNQSDFIELFNATIAKVEEHDKELEPKDEPITPTAVVLENWSAHLTRMENEAKSLGLTDHFVVLLNKLISNANFSSVPSAFIVQPTAKPAKRKQGRPKKAK